MALTKKLWKFWGGLNSGKIDWSFLDSTNWTTEEKDTAAGMLVDRGFVKVFDESKFPDANGLWKVICGANMNPVYKGKRFYFTAKKYARMYVDHLYSSKKALKGYSIEEV